MSKHLCYFMLAFVLTGVLARVESILSANPQSRFAQPLPTTLIWSNASLANSSPSSNNSETSR